jgi:hypothetical protein
VPVTGHGGGRGLGHQLPVGVARVLLADLIPRGQITVMTQRQSDRPTSTDLLKEVLHGLRAL